MGTSSSGIHHVRAPCWDGAEDEKLAHDARVPRRLRPVRRPVRCAVRDVSGHDCNVAARLIPKTGTPAPPAKGLAAIPGASMGWGTRLPKAAAPVKKAAKAATKKK